MKARSMIHLRMFLWNGASMESREDFLSCRWYSIVSCFSANCSLMPPSDLELETTNADVRHLISSVSDLLSRPSGSLCAPPHIAESLLEVIDYFSLVDYPTEHSQLHIPLPLCPPLAGNSASPLNVQHNIKLNRKTTLSTLYTYEDSNAYIEYPDTNTDYPIGYLFRYDPCDWRNPTHNFAYSLGKPAGQSKAGQEVFLDLLVGKDGNCVPCVESHFTCIYSFILIFLKIQHLTQNV